MTKCLKCDGQGVVVKQRPCATYGGRLTRFAFPCSNCLGRGKVEVELNPRLNAAAGRDD